MNKHTEKTHMRKRKLLLWRRLLAIVLAMSMVIGLPGIHLRSVEAESSDAESINLENYLTDSSSMYITVYIDGVKHTYTPDELTQKGLVVPKGAPVQVQLYFDTISQVKKGQTLVYQLPANLMNYSTDNPNGYVWQDIVWEENTSGAEVEAADWVIDTTGKLTVTIRDDFFENNKHDDDTVDLFGFNIKFSGSFSSERGEHSGNDDNVIQFRGSTDGTGNISFTIPFEYLNENANAQVEKTVVNYDAATRTASYKVTVTAPSTNIYTATNVVVTDLIQCDSKYIETVKNSTQIYQNYTASTGQNSFDSTNGVWTIGSMTPGQTETLTYDLVISGDAYKTGAMDKINNIATVTFNDDGTNQDYATLQLPTSVLNKEAVKTDKGGLTYTDNIGTYMLYKLSVTANNGDESNLRVEDGFSDASLISQIVVDGEPSTGTVTKDDTTASLVWIIDTLKKGETATLTYKAYLDAEAWHTQSASSYTSVPGDETYRYVTKSVNNNAKLYVNSNSDTPAIADVVTTKNDLSKKWVKKNGRMVTENNSKKGKLEYTVEVNSDPVSDKIVSIYDTLTSGGTYESGGVLTVKRYTSSDKKTLVDSNDIPLADIVTKDGDGYRWDLDLVSRGLNGAYFYVLTYYVESTAVNVVNSAGIGFGVGPGYAGGISIQGGGGMNYGTDYEKTFGAHNYEEGYTPWTVTVKKTIPAGAVYEDKLSDEYVYHHQLFWFDDASLAATVIKFNGQTLVEGVDYTITGVRDSEDLANKYDPEGKHYNIFQITFNREIEATSSNPLTIEYKQILNTTAQDEGFYSIDGCTLLAYNYCRWGMPEYGEVVYPGYSANWNDSFQWNIPLLKDDSTYDADTGTITWYVTVNDKTSISGNATLEEYLPEGLSFVSATIEGKPDKNGNATNGYKFPNVTTKEFSTKLGDITQEEYTNEDGKTCVKVNIPITGLVAYYGQSVNFKDNVNNVGKYSGWSEAGMIMVKVVTKVDSDWYMNLSKDTTLTNTAVLTDNTGLPEGGVKATGTATVPHTTLIDKSMVNQDAPAYVEYALNINSGASTLAGDAGSLEIIDIMSSGMSFSTDHANNFKVYDVTGVSDDDLLDSDGNVIASKAQSLAIADVSSQCTIQDVTGQEFDGMTEDEIGKPTYLITVPDGKHLVVLYWAAFEGSEGDQVTVSNRASFFFNNAIQSGGGDETSDKVAARASSSTVFTGPFFNLKKSDQFGNLVEGVTYSLYEVSVDSDGNETGRTKLMTQTTDEDGSVYFGHRTGNGGDNYDPLSKNKLYCLIEESAPTGYALNSDPYYFEFKESGHDVVDHPSTVTLHQFVSGGTYSFTNQFTPASYSVPVKKTINGKTVSSDTEFSFTLTQTDGNKVYTDENYATEISKDGIQASIKGSGETLFDKLYFTETGEYTFSLTENDLSDEAEAMGYSKDTNSFEITVEIGTNADNELVVKKATFTSAKDPDTTLSLDTDVPTFDNGSYMTGTITLHATKEVTNRDLPVQEGEFAFTVSAGGEVVAETNEDGTVKLDENNKPVKKLFYTEEGGEINLEIPIDQDDVGTKTYIISEVDLGDPTIKYTTDRVRVQVTIAEDGKGGVEATNYKYLTDPAVFTNDYIASGSVTLEGTKLLKSESTGEALSLTKGEFNFIVKEGSTQVATGSNEADGSITFTEITYDASDIGTHTYVISEKNEGLNYIEYTDQTVTAQVTVTDAGDGKLAADVQYIDGTLDDNGHALFTNISTLIVPSGIRTDILPFAFVFVVAGSLGVAMIIRIRRRRRGLR